MNFLPLPLLLVLLAASTTATTTTTTTKIPNVDDHAALARSLVSKSYWGVLTTVNPNGSPFGNVMSFVSTLDGTPIFFLAVTKDPTGFFAVQDPRASFTTSPYMAAGSNNGSTMASLLTPNSPVCTKITLNGELLSLEKSPEENARAKDAFFSGHPQFNELPVFLQSDFKIFKLDMKGIMLMNGCSPPVEVPVEKYKAAS